jgi:hypothetical protein
MIIDTIVLLEITDSLFTNDFLLINNYASFSVKKSNYIYFLNKE